MIKQMTRIYNEIRKINSSEGKYCVDYGFFWWLDNKQGGSSPEMLSQEYFWRIQDAQKWLDNNKDLVIDQLAF